MAARDIENVLEDTVSETAVTLGMVFHLSSRQSEGLLRSLFALMKLDNDVPDHTTISRRKAKLGKVPFYQDKQKTPLHILIDSSGLAAHAGQAAQSTKEQGLSQAPSVCRRAEWRSRRRRADEQKSPRFIAGCIACRTDRQSHLIGQS